MGFGTQLRRLLGTLALGLLAVTLASAESVACGDILAPQSDGCCNPDGSCKTSPDSDSSGCCLKAGPNELVLIEQHSQAGAVVSFALHGEPANVPPVRPALRSGAILAQYSPPDRFLLNSAFLI
ncbi:MAG: hypothetical protein LAP38_00270 [Acidobacteriia bacterium]|nr:hypothetical protein [Terriglobia bacterium]